MKGQIFKINIVENQIWFDIELDKARVKSWESHHPDITRMGRVNWWTEFCNQHNLIPR